MTETPESSFPKLVSRIRTAGDIVKVFCEVDPAGMMADQEFRLITLASGIHLCPPLYEKARWNGALRRYFRANNIRAFRALISRRDYSHHYPKAIIEEGGQVKVWLGIKTKCWVGGKSIEAVVLEYFEKE